MIKINQSSEEKKSVNLINIITQLDGKIWVVLAIENQFRIRNRLISCGLSRR